MSHPTASEHLRVLTDAGFLMGKEDQAMSVLSACRKGHCSIQGAVEETDLRIQT
ncbi:MAG: hypothetical protein JSR66_27620 [Proteobacteria bacterium]|nr:hypothetical protein [Pseudomonadota bacterium]